MRLLLLALLTLAAVVACFVGWRNRQLRARDEWRIPDSPPGWRYVPEVNYWVPGNEDDPEYDRMNGVQWWG